MARKKGKRPSGVPGRPGGIVFWAGGHVYYQEDCVRGEPPKDTKLWAIVGRCDRGWMPINTFRAVMAGGIDASDLEEQA